MACHAWCPLQPKVWSALKFISLVKGDAEITRRHPARWCQAQRLWILAPSATQAYACTHACITGTSWCKPLPLLQHLALDILGEKFSEGNMSHLLSKMHARALTKWQFTLLIHPERACVLKKLGGRVCVCISATPRPTKFGRIRTCPEGRMSHCC